MSRFPVNIVVHGLYRIVNLPTDGQRRIMAVAPWVDEGPGTCEHQFLVRWRPFQVGEAFPPSTQATWPLRGARLGFEFDGPDADGLVGETTDLALPRLFAQRENGQDVPSTGILNRDLEPFARIRTDTLADPKDFRWKTDSVGNEERPFNSAGVVGQVAIDKGRLERFPEASPNATIEPSVWDNPYRDQFVNRFHVRASEVSSITVKATLFGPVPVGEQSVEESITLVADPDALQGRSLTIEVLHLCPTALFGFCSGSPEPAGKQIPDRDFDQLYELSENPGELLRRIRQIAGDSEPHRPVPVRPRGSAGCPRWECGCSTE